MSSKVFRLVAGLSGAECLWGLRPVSPARAWRHREAARCAAARLAVSSLGCPPREAEEVAERLLLPAVVSARCAQAVPRSGEAAERSDAGAAQPWAVPVE
jgi:hypothetical protein